MDCAKIAQMLRVSAAGDFDTAIILTALNTPKQTDDIISVCDRLMVSLSAAEENAVTIMDMLQEMKDYPLQKARAKGCIPHSL